MPSFWDIVAFLERRGKEGGRGGIDRWMLQKSSPTLSKRERGKKKEKRGKEEGEVLRLHESIRNKLNSNSFPPIKKKEKKEERKKKKRNKRE